MTKIYMDTSSFIKRYSMEKGSDTVSAFFESSHEIVTSYWTLAEAAAAIDKKVARKQITEKERDLALSVLFSDVLDKNIAFVKISDEFLYPIVEKIMVHHISADDSLQLFSCIASQSSVFLACDRNILRAAEKEGLTALDVERGEDRDELERLLGKR